jgi:predicted transcriptional regulator
MGISNYLKEHEAQKMTLEQLTEQKTGAEIAAELGITRQAVSQALKRALKKVYIETGKLDKGWGPFEVATVMSQIFNVDDEDDLSKFIRLFPPDIRKEIETDAKKRMTHLKDKKEQ